MKGVLAASGVTIAGASSVFFTATGIGAAALGTGLTLGGTAYQIYRHQHDIKYYAKTFDIPLRKHLTKKQISKEIVREKDYQKKFRELEKQLQTVQFLIPIAQETFGKVLSEELDETTFRSVLAERQFVNLTDSMKSIVEEISKNELTIVKTHEIYMKFKSKLKELKTRLSDEKTKRFESQFSRKFSKYSLHTLSILKSIIKEGLSHEETASKIKNLLLTHGHDVRGKVTFGDVMDFIIEDKKISKKKIK